MTGTAQHRSRRRAGVVWLVGLLAALAVVLAASVLASDRPDGLEKVAEEHGFLESADEHDLAASPVADYGVEGVGEGPLSTALAGLVGVAATLALGAGLFWSARRRRHQEPTS